MSDKAPIRKKKSNVFRETRELVTPQSLGQLEAQVTFAFKEGEVCFLSQIKWEHCRLSATIPILTCSTSMAASRLEIS